MRRLLFFLLFFSLSFACNNSISGFVPAVGESEGTLVGLTISLEKGTGSTYLSIDPFVGIITQESIELAIKNAYSFSGKKREDCDITVSFHSSSTEYIDGPSAGAAITTYLYALINDLEVRDDLIITGGIDGQGFLIAVGGVYEKTLVSLEKGYTNIIVPPITIEEKILLSKLKKDYDFKIIEEDHVTGVFSFAIFGKHKEETLFSIPPEEILELEDYPFLDEELEEFVPVMDDMVDLQQETTEDLVVPEGFESLDEYYSSVLNNTEIIGEKGYLFTAANRAFLDYISISTISNAETLDFSKKKEEVEECLEGLPEVTKTKENFEWVISAELREYWARDKLESLDLEKEMLMEERYFVFGELMYSDAWCQVSSSLRNVALENSDGQEIDESLWEPYAKQLILEAEALEIEDYLSEEDPHLSSARKLYDDEKYGAAIYDALFVLELNNVHLGDMSEEELNSTIEQFSSVQPSSLWGKIYHTQGYYLSHSDPPSLVSAYEIYNYAFELDEATQYMEDLITYSQEEEHVEDPCSSLFLLLPLLSLIVIYLKVPL